VIWAVAVGGALGALARWGATAGLARISRGTTLAGYPLGTLAVNVLGSFLLGYLVFHERLPLSPALRVGIGTGFLGALTTFSTFELDLFLLHGERGPWAAAAYLGANVAIGFLALLAGRALASGPIS
jgi:CrcB protein